ncbi:hypothetical protein [Chondromyces crocatus]|uniref:Uncharacterized protein n=1 Tax=Chondromyces crocatus TaxID=52 RepID=A0A0K1EF09_CHOCO|nr:hypothetical protein [Chondromyces crocatus]AKT39460.1 uncharacterized protein CMC5_036070 [Chondromyces crocatus]
MRERWGAWCAAAGAILGGIALQGGAVAGEAPTCSAWKAAAAPHDRLELRACRAVETGTRGPGEAPRDEPLVHRLSVEGTPDDVGPTHEEPSEADDEDEIPDVQRPTSRDDRRTPVRIELRSGYDDTRKIRIELTASGGQVEILDLTATKGINQAGTCAACRDLSDLTAWRVLDGGVPPEPEVVRPIAGNTHMEVLARDLRLTDANAERLKRIAAAYFKATRKRLVVTGGTRPPQRQAELMYDKLKRGDDIVSLYENKQAVTEVRNAYRTGAAQALPRKTVVRLMKEVIDAQIARGVYISKHLRSGAVDVRSWDMVPAMEQAFREAVKKEPGVALMDERKSAEPHFHLTMP